MLARLGALIRGTVGTRILCTNVYGVARTSLALGTLGTLIFSRASDIFRPAVGISAVPTCFTANKFGLFCLAGEGHLESARWIAIAVLAIVASGWRPRLTGIAHWYVSASLFTTGVLVDGGDQATTVLTLLLIPITLIDSRRWHWGAPLVPSLATSRPTLKLCAQLVALSALWAIRLQVAGIYFQAAVSKASVTEWRDGTAVYYWFTDPWFGFAEPVKSAATNLLANGLVVAVLTWGPMVLEIMLFAGLIASRGARRILLPLGVAFHGAIAVVHGLLSFAFAMWGAVTLLLRPLDEEFVPLRRWTMKIGAAVTGLQVRARRPLSRSDAGVAVVRDSTAANGAG